MRTNQIFFLAAVLLSAQLLAGCAKDQNTDDFARQQAEEDFGKFQAAAGTYTGPVYSQQSKEFMGILTVALTPQMKMVDGAGTTAKSDSKPVFTGQVTFQREGRPCPIPDASFDPRVQGFRDRHPGVASGPVFGPELHFHDGLNSSSSSSGSNTSDGDTDVIHIEGHIDGGTFTGTLNAAGYEAYGATFSLATGTSTSIQNTQALAALRQSQATLVPDTLTFVGQTVFKRTGDTKPVHLIVQTNRGTDEEQFLDLFEAKKPVQIQLDYGENLVITYASGTLDDRAGILRAFQASGPNELGVTTLAINLECTGTSTTSFTCNHLIDTGNIMAGKTQVTLASGQVAEIKVDPRDTSPIVDAYAGSVNFAGGASREAVLTINHDPTNRAAEELVNEFYTLSDGRRAEQSLNYG